MKNYFYNLLLTLTNLLFPVLSFPYVSRVLGPEGIGQVQFVFSFAQYFSIIASVGIPIYGLREIAKHRDDSEARSKTFSELILINFLACVCLALAYLFVINVFHYFGHQHQLYMVATLMVLLGFTNVEWIYSGMENFKAIALRSVGFKMLGLLMLYAFIKSRADYDLYLYLLIFSYLGNNLLSLMLLRKDIKFVSKGVQLKHHLSPLFFILATTLAASMYTDMDTVLLGFLANKKAVGLYTAAVKLSKIAIPFVTSMNVVLIPQIGRQFAENNLKEVNFTLQKALRFILFFAVPATFGLALLAPELIVLFSGKEFLPAVSSMRMLALLPFVIGIAHLFLFMILVPSNHNRQMFVCVAGGLAASLLLNFLLVPRYNEAGSAFANVVAEIVVTGMYYYFIRKFFTINFPWRLLFEAVFCSLLFIPVVLFTRSLAFSVLLSVLLAVGECIVIYSLAQLLLKNDVALDGIAFIKSKVDF